MALACIVALSAAGAEPPARGAELPARGWLGASTANGPAVKLPVGETRDYPASLDIVFVAPGSPAERAGLREGDTILALDRKPLDPKDGDPALRYRQIVEAAAIGASVHLTVIKRSPTLIATLDGQGVDADALVDGMPGSVNALTPGSHLVLDVSRPLHVQELDLAIEGHPHDASPATPRVAIADPDGGLKPLLDELIAKDGARADVDDQLARLDRLGVHGAPLQLSMVRTAFEHPARWGDQLDVVPRAVTAAEVVSTAADLLDIEPGAPLPPLTARGSLDADLGVLAALVTETAALRERAFASLSKDDRAFLAAHARDVAEALGDTIYLHADAKRSRATANRRWLELAQRVDLTALMAAAQSWARLGDRAFLLALERDLRAAPNAADEWVARRMTDYGEIVVGGTGRTTWRDMEPAIAIDLGGDDVHANRSGSSSFDERPLAALIDFAGDDAYEATDAFAQGSGLGGCGLLVDLAGDDRYLGVRAAQGVGVLGVGIVIDAAGSDTYRASMFSQGVGLFGAGAVIDEAGDDRYEATAFAQALGLPRGLGLLHDVAGNDRYFAKGGAMTGYGTQGVYDAWSQGCGLGLRYLAAGGCGLLADDAGRDDYESGNFSQGGGYYFGLGMLHDGGTSDDRYVGSRYGMGWAAHQAAGAFTDDGGNDLYRTHHGVICGLAWDESVAWFRDRGGDDRYEAGFFSLGASAHNGFVVFRDDDGSDAYVGAEVAQAGPNDYHGGTCLSLFLDLGKGTDTYAQGAPKPSGSHAWAIDRESITERAKLGR